MTPRSEGVIGTVLLVEDDDVVALTMAHELQQLGLVVRRVVTGQDAFEAACFGLSRPAVVVMDVLLPGLSGIEATRLVRDYERRRGLPAVPILGCTGLDRQQTHEAMLRAGMDALAHKPLPVGQLALAVSRLMHRVGVSTLAPALAAG